MWDHNILHVGYPWRRSDHRHAGVEVSIRWKYLPCREVVHGRPADDSRCYSVVAEDPAYVGECEDQQTHPRLDWLLLHALPGAPDEWNWRPRALRVCPTRDIKCVDSPIWPPLRRSVSCNEQPIWWIMGVSLYAAIERSFRVDRRRTQTLPKGVRAAGQRYWSKIYRVEDNPGVEWPCWQLWRLGRPAGACMTVPSDLEG